MTVVISISGSASMVIDALCRLQLVARRWDGEVRLGRPEPALVELLERCGLAGVLDGEGQRGVEQGEQSRVEEGVDPDDLAL